MHRLRIALVALMLASFGCSLVGASTQPPTALDVVKRLRDQGLPITEALEFTAETDPNHLLGRPGGYASKTTFKDGRLQTRTEGQFSLEDGGSVEVYPTAAAAKGRRDLLAGISEKAPILGEYTYLRGTVVLRVSRILTPAQAAEYDAALAAMPL